jgi:general secretion pathway protein D
MQRHDTKSTTGVPGLSAIPILGKLFSSDTINHSDSEYVLAIIPHIVRTPDISDVNLRGIAAGNSTTVKLNYAPRKQAPADGAPAPAPAAPPASAAPGLGGLPLAPPRTAPVPLVPGIALVPQATEPPPGAPAETVPAGDLRVMFTPAEASVQLNQPVSVSLVVENAADLFAAPLTVKFDPKILRLNDVVQGNLLGKDGQQVVFSKNVLNDQGEATVGLNRFPGASGITSPGAATLVTLIFQAVGRGDTTVALPQLTLRNAKGQTISAAAPQLAVRVK